MTECIGLTPTLEPPYFAVIFTSLRTEVDGGYEEVSARMLQLASVEPGFLGVESVRDGAIGITVSYWATEEDLLRWKRNMEHREAQRGGRGKWYSRFQVRVARVEREYGFPLGNRDLEPAAQ